MELASIAPLFVGDAFSDPEVPDTTLRMSIKHPILPASTFSLGSFFGPGDIIIYDKMESEFYCEVVHFLMRQLEKQFDEEEFYIVHDNAKFSESVETQTFLIRNGLTHHSEPIPAYSPDMNLIENV